jgi:hypothetical protein
MNISYTYCRNPVNDPSYCGILEKPKIPEMPTPTPTEKVTNVEPAAKVNANPPHSSVDQKPTPVVPANPTPLVPAKPTLVVPAKPNKQNYSWKSKGGFGQRDQKN